MRFEWDPLKAESNFRKHGIDFEYAEMVFDDPLFRVYPDRVEFGEERFHAIGKVLGEYLLVVFAYDQDEEEEYVRIISARRPSRSERRDHERGA